MTAEELVHAILRKHTSRDTFTVATRIDELGTDSLTMMEMKMEAEDELGVELPDDEVDKIQSVGDFVNLIKSYSRGRLDGGGSQAADGA